jgi:hypothetical protein
MMPKPARLLTLEGRRALPSTAVEITNARTADAQGRISAQKTNTS